MTVLDIVGTLSMTVCAALAFYAGVVGLGLMLTSWLINAYLLVRDLGRPADDRKRLRGRA